MSGVSAAVACRRCMAYSCIDEINDAGGLLGRNIEAIQTDGQSEPQRYQQLSRQLILDEKVDMLIGGCTSATREAVRGSQPVQAALHLQHAVRGGVADTYTFCTGLTGQAQWETMMPYMIEKYGPNYYVIAATTTSASTALHGSTGRQREWWGERGSGVYSHDHLNVQCDDSAHSESEPRFPRLNDVGQSQMAFYAQWVLGLPRRFLKGRPWPCPSLRASSAQASGGR